MKIHIDSEVIYNKQRGWIESIDNNLGQVVFYSPEVKPVKVEIKELVPFEGDDDYPEWLAVMIEDEEGKPLCALRFSPEDTVFLTEFANTHYQGDFATMLRDSIHKGLERLIAENNERENL